MRRFVLSLRWWLGALLALSMVFLVVIVVVWRVQATSTQADSSQRVIKEVSRIYLVPTNETPTVAKIQDISKVRANQTFYANAKDGDFLLVYSKSGLALLYRESINKLINVRPITVDTSPRPS